MQSGQAKRPWVLDYTPETPPFIEPLMGYVGSSDMKQQVVLRFDSQSEAVAYAERHGIPYRLIPEQKGRDIQRSYSENFSANRPEPWTH